MLYVLRFAATLALALTVTDCGGSAKTLAGPTTSPTGEKVLPPQSVSETYESAESYVFKEDGRFVLPAGAFKLELVEIRPARTSVLVDSQTAAGLTYYITTSCDIPDLFYGVAHFIIDADGNRMSTHWFEGGGGEGANYGMIRKCETKHYQYWVPVDPLRNIPSQVPGIGIIFYWSRKAPGWSDYVYQKQPWTPDDPALQMNIRVDWHRP